MNLPAIAAIYKFEMARWGRTFLQSIVSPVIATSLYFVVFGAAIGSRITEIEGVEYGVFIVPGLVMLTLLMLGMRSSSTAYFDMALLMGLFGFVSSTALAKFLLRGEVIEP